MIKIATWLATWLYSGYLKPASGTWGTLAGLPLCLVTAYYLGAIGIILGALILFCIGLWASSLYQNHTHKHDPSEIVIDEVAGMMIACTPLLYHFDVITIIACFVLFRILDAVKEGPVGWCDKNINGALGVMIDDIVAGLMTTIIIIGLLLWMN
jgi:phosphatidylglycerophosphatase A